MLSIPSAHLSLALLALSEIREMLDHLPILHQHVGGGGGSDGGDGGTEEESAPPPPKGWMAIRVGSEGEEQQRFVVPVEYVNHPLFAGLLKGAEEEYGFRQHGSIVIPCHVEEFRYVRGIILRDVNSSAAAGSQRFCHAHHHQIHHHPHHHHHHHYNHHHHHNHHHQHHVLHLPNCFKA